MNSSVRPIYLDFWVTYEAFRDDLPMKIINIYQFLSQLSEIDFEDIMWHWVTGSYVSRS